jgi:hypothetical protein
MKFSFGRYILCPMELELGWEMDGECYVFISVKIQFMDLANNKAVFVLDRGMMMV